MVAAVVDNSTNVVLNTIVANADTDTALEGSYLVNIPDDINCEIGWFYDPINKIFLPPATPTISE